MRPLTARTSRRQCGWLRGLRVMASAIGNWSVVDQGEGRGDAAANTRGCGLWLLFLCRRTRQHHSLPDCPSPLLPLHAQTCKNDGITTTPRDGSFATMTKMPTLHPILPGIQLYTTSPSPQYMHIMRIEWTIAVAPRSVRCAQHDGTALSASSPRASQGGNAPDPLRTQVSRRLPNRFTAAASCARGSQVGGTRASEWHNLATGWMSRVPSAAKPRGLLFSYWD